MVVVVGYRVVVDTVVEVVVVSMSPFRAVLISVSRG